VSIPEAVLQKKLFQRLAGDSDLVSILGSLRNVVVSFAETTTRSVPDFTDHTIRHMDALWGVGEQILSDDEIDALTSAEVFLLGCGFYLHDIGMAYAATSDGLQKLRASTPYQAFLASVPPDQRSAPDIEALAVSVAVRQLHANAAEELASQEIPGSRGRFLFESQTAREAWGRTCGQVAASHHWSVPKLESKFGLNGPSPLPGNRSGDLLYVAACLRLIDYAHINRERASSLDRAFRLHLSPESDIHWVAQQDIDGPIREQDELVYRAANPIQNVDAWWLYYEMLKGLDSEIRSVQRMLTQRRSEYKRISLMGARGASSPEQAIALIPTSGFLPIEINMRTGAIDRLVEILAGETLYGPNPMAAIRELVQNARDAVTLKAEVVQSDIDRALLSLPITISLNTKGRPATLQIIDHGIGMTQRVLTDYLISIASDYWGSQFAIDYPAVAGRGFKNAGKFGIGFLSVFMLGDEVSVETNRNGTPRYRLQLRGVGRRGELREVATTGGSGTAISIKLGNEPLAKITPLAELVSVYAPAVPHSLEVLVDGEKTEFPLGWLGGLSPNEFATWVERAVLTLRSNNSRTVPDPGRLFMSRRRWIFGEQRKWPKQIPEYVEGNTRLQASFEGVSVLCLRGLAVETISTPGFAGLIELDALRLEASRNRAVSPDVSDILDKATVAVAPQIIANLDTMADAGLLIDKTDFISYCASFYGKNVVSNSGLPWVSQLSFPGNSSLIDTRSLVSAVAGAQCVFIAYNSGPWTALKKWQAALPKADEVAILLDGVSGDGLDYVSSSEPRLGSISSLWDKWSEVSLFSLLIETIAETWQKSPTDLVNESGWVHESNHLHGRVSRRP
jgi:hypothetical protein